MGKLYGNIIQPCNSLNSTSTVLSLNPDDKIIYVNITNKNLLFTLSKALIVGLELIIILHNSLTTPIKYDLLFSSSSFGSTYKVYNEDFDELKAQAYAEVNIIKNINNQQYLYITHSYSWTEAWINVNIPEPLKWNQTLGLFSYTINVGTKDKSGNISNPKLKTVTKTVLFESENKTTTADFKSEKVQEELNGYSAETLATIYREGLPESWFKFSNGTSTGSFIYNSTAYPFEVYTSGGTSYNVFILKVPIEAKYRITITELSNQNLNSAYLYLFDYQNNNSGLSGKTSSLNYTKIYETNNVLGTDYYYKILMPQKAESVPEYSTVATIQRI